MMSLNKLTEICCFLWLLMPQLARSFVPSNLLHNSKSLKKSHYLGSGKSSIDYFTTREIESYAKYSGLELKSAVTGPFIRLEAFPIGSSESIGYVTAFIRPFPFGLLQLETIQVKNRRQTLGFQRKDWTIDGPGISFIMGSYVLSWAREKGCRTAQLLAVNDSPQMHQVLIKLYSSFGFTSLREIEESVQDRLVWGAAGTLMELDMIDFFKNWAPKLKIMIEAAKRKGEGEQQEKASADTQSQIPASTSR